MLTSPDGEPPIKREWVHRAPSAVHIGAADLPFVDIGGGNLVRVLQVFPSDNIWITENVFQAGFQSPMPMHTGSVWGHTFSGSWNDLESEFVNRAGSFLFEPASSVHALQILEDDTRVRWHIHGANLHLDEERSIASIVFGKAPHPPPSGADRPRRPGGGGGAGRHPGGDGHGGGAGPGPGADGTAAGSPGTEERQGTAQALAEGELTGAAASVAMALAALAALAVALLAIPLGALLRL